MRYFQLTHDHASWDQLKDDRPKILCIGCSFTKGFRYGGFSDSKMRSYPLYLSQMTHVDVVNCGVHTWGSRYHTSMISHYQDISPAIVVFQTMCPFRNQFTPEEADLFDNVDSNQSVSDIVHDTWPVANHVMDRMYGKYRMKKFEFTTEEIHDAIIDDAQIVKRIIDELDRPTVFMYNSLNYPYMGQSEFAHKEINRIKRDSDQILLTDFDKTFWKTPWDSHPTPRRHRMQAIMLKRMIDNEGWA